MASSTKCFYCEITSDEVPLFKLTYQEKDLYVCPQHVPLLIHDPSKLTGKLEGAERLTPYSAE